MGHTKWNRWKSGFGLVLRYISDFGISYTETVQHTVCVFLTAIPKKTHPEGISCLGQRRKKF
jgi:hypothetical protein